MPVSAAIIVCVLQILGISPSAPSQRLSEVRVITVGHLHI